MSYELYTSYEQAGWLALRHHGARPAEYEAAFSAVRAILMAYRRTTKATPARACGGHYNEMQYT